MADNAYQQLLALAAKHKLPDSELVHFIAGYGEIVTAWLEQPCLPGELPMSFSEFLTRLDRALTD
jgi:hypothetical protein